MKVYVAYYYFSGWDNKGACKDYALMGIFSSYENAFESFQDRYEARYDENYLNNPERYKTYVDDYGVIEEIIVDEILSRNEFTVR